jgi:uncharacterized protein
MILAAQQCRIIASLEKKVKKMNLPEIITPELIEYLKKTYLLSWNGIHGWAHWVRVCENGLHLARQNGANQTVVALFAFTHDMARRSDGADWGHGKRAAERIRSELQGKFFQLSETELNHLVEAVSLHTDGHKQADITVQTCWDADRLDLGRAGIVPHSTRLCTPQAKDPATIQWAYLRSTAN